MSRRCHAEILVVTSPLETHLHTVSAGATDAARALGVASFWAIGASIAHVGFRPIVHCSVIYIPCGARKGWWNAMNPNSDVGSNIFGLSSALT